MQNTCHDEILKSTKFGENFYHIYTIDNYYTLIFIFFLSDKSNIYFIYWLILFSHFLLLLTYKIHAGFLSYEFLISQLVQYFRLLTVTITGYKILEIFFRLDHLYISEI